jgi:hypothetical protein
MNRFAFVAVGLLFACACARPTPPPSPPSDRFGAPAVAAPRDVSTFAADPCQELLTRSDLTHFRLSPAASAKTLATGDRACDWRSEDSLRYLTVIVVAGRDVLVDTYRTRQFDIFEPAEVSGLPAARERAYLGSITCTVTVGTADGQGFVSDFTGRGEGANDACGQAQAIAERIVAALPPLNK